MGAKPADGSRAAGNERFFLEQDAPAVGRYNLDLTSLTRAPTRIVAAGGSVGRQYFPYKSAARLAQLLEIEFVEFPGAHAGYISDPQPFATRLEQLLPSEDRFNAGRARRRSRSSLQGTRPQ